MYSEIWGRIAAIILFIGFNLTFFPQFILGYQGMPRRYAMYAPEFQVLNVMSTAGATIMALGYLLPFFYLISSLRNGAIAGPNPWRSTGLEWQTSSPPTTFNFDVIPNVKIGPYAYNPAADEAEDMRLEMLATERKLEEARRNLEAEQTLQNGPTNADVHGDVKDRN